MKPMRTWDDIFPDGKHKGKTVKEVYDTDVEYLCWFIASTTFAVFPYDMKLQILDHRKQKIRERLHARDVQGNA